MKKKYLVKPGYVTSRNDGDRHFINSSKLMKLYNVKQSECYFFTEDNRKTYPNDLIVLTPRYDGKYKNYGETQGGSDE